MYLKFQPLRHPFIFIDDYERAKNETFKSPLAARSCEYEYAKRAGSRTRLGLRFSVRRVIIVSSDDSLSIVKKLSARYAPRTSPHFRFNRKLTRVRTLISFPREIRERFSYFETRPIRIRDNYKKLFANYSLTVIH